MATKTDVEFLTMLEVAENIIIDASNKMDTDDFFAKDICDSLIDTVESAKKQQSALMGL
ncbi:hypothetical protein [Lactococcus lactis]|uniref:hypothetical protein n=1 Tax=Lactococcus lactis TaxID=1358 RepID=UPI0035BC5EE0